MSSYAKDTLQFISIFITIFLQYLIIKIYRIILQTIDCIFLKVSDAAEEMKIVDMYELAASFRSLAFYMKVSKNFKLVKFECLCIEMTVTQMNIKQYNVCQSCHMSQQKERNVDKTQSSF